MEAPLCSLKFIPEPPGGFEPRHMMCCTRDVVAVIVTCGTWRGSAGGMHDGATVLFSSKFSREHIYALMGAHLFYALFLRTPFTEGCAGANKKASPTGRHQEQGSQQRCTFRPTTFSSVSPVHCHARALIQHARTARSTKCNS